MRNKCTEIDYLYLTDILGPILYTIYVSPLFDLTSMSNFADDNFMIEWSLCRVELNTNTPIIAHQLRTPFLNFMPLLQSLIPWASKQGTKSKAGAIKFCKEKNYFPA